MEEKVYKKIYDRRMGFDIYFKARATFDVLFRKKEICTFLFLCYSLSLSFLFLFFSFFFSSTTHSYRNFITKSLGTVLKEINKNIVGDICHRR